MIIGRDEVRRVIFYGALLAAGTAVLQWLDYQRLARTQFTDIYIVLIAVAFLATSVVTVVLAWALRAALPFGDDERRTSTEKGVTDVRTGA